MRRIIPFTLLALTIAVLGAGLLGPARAEGAVISGTVIGVDDQGITVRRADGAEQHFDLATGTLVPSDVRPGMKVNLTVEDANGVQTVTAVEGVTATVPAAQTQTAQTTPATGAAEDAQEELPATASPMWTLALTGLLALGGGFLAMRQRRKSLRSRQERLAGFGIHVN